MSSRNAQFAEAVKVAINAASAANQFNVQFTAKRVYVPELDLSKYKTLTVMVWPLADKHLIEGRDDISHNLKCSIAVVQSLAQAADPTDATTCATVDQLLWLSEQIADFFQPTTVIMGQGLIDVSHLLFDENRMLQHRAFLSQIIPTFKGDFQ